eukprot:7474-Pelagococcus_subviridis.AAC.2
MQKYSVDRSQLRIARAMYAASSDLFAKTWRLNSDARIGGARSTTAPGGPTVVPTPFRSSRSLDRTDRPKNRARSVPTTATSRRTIGTASAAASGSPRRIGSRKLRHARKPYMATRRRRPRSPAPRSARGIELLFGRICTDMSRVDLGVCRFYARTVRVYCVRFWPAHKPHPYIMIHGFVVSRRGNFIQQDEERQDDS